MGTEAIGIHNILDAILKRVFAADRNTALQHLALASAMPILASALWHFSRTVVEVTDSEQSLWVHLWLAQQGSAIRRVRRLLLLSARAGAGSMSIPMFRNPFGHRFGLRQRAGEDDDNKGGGGRFDTPKLSFTPARGVAAWSLFGWWPVSVESLASNAYREESGGYALTVWFAPRGMDVARDLILEGRQLWLAKRAAKTEIWLPNTHCIPTDFKVVTRPSRPLSTVIVEDGIKEELRADAIRFLQGEEWYVRRGIPYRRGFLLHGPPGCGKTSLITALAGSLRLPIVFLSLNSSDMSDSTLLSALSESPRDSIVLIEDVDCAFVSNANLTRREMMMCRESVTLSGLLNAIDGVAGQEGRLLFMTTNHIERLDAALIRPGRVDVQYHLGNASKSAAGELFDQFFTSLESGGGKKNDPNVLSEARCAFLSEVEDYVHSFAKLQGVVMKARDEPELVAEEMRKLVSSANASPPETSSMAPASDASPPEDSTNEAKAVAFFDKLQDVMMKAYDEPELAAEEMRTLVMSVNAAEASSTMEANDASPSEVPYVVPENIVPPSQNTHHNVSDGQVCSRKLQDSFTKAHDDPGLLEAGDMRKPDTSGKTVPPPEEPELKN